MDEITLAVMAIVGTDAVALNGDVVSNPADVAAKLKAFADEKDKLAKFATTTRDALALSADTALDATAGTLMATVEKAKKVDEITAERDALVLSAETAAKADIIKQAKADGKIVGEKMEAWANGLDSVALSAFVENAPVIVEPGKTTKTKKDDAVALSADEADFYAEHGLTAEDMQKYGGQ